jgi:hypothetical protein
LSTLPAALCGSTVLWLDARADQRRRRALHHKPELSITERARALFDSGLVSPLFGRARE